MSIFREFLHTITPKNIRSHPTCGMDNVVHRETWLNATIGALPEGGRILDAGTGELQYKPLCKHLNYVRDWLQGIVIFWFLCESKAELTK